jgi:hypothetical protein
LSTPLKQVAFAAVVPELAVLDVELSLPHADTAIEPVTARLMRAAVRVIVTGILRED